MINSLHTHLCRHEWENHRVSICHTCVYASTSLAPTNKQHSAIHACSITSLTLLVYILLLRCCFFFHLVPSGSMSANNIIIVDLYTCTPWDQNDYTHAHTHTHTHTHTRTHHTRTHTHTHTETQRAHTHTHAHI